MSGVMNSVAHELKVWRMYFDALRSGTKTFEFRKDDRTPSFEVGDVLRLREWGGSTEDYSGRECFRRVRYVARGGVIPKGFCCMRVSEADEVDYQLALDNGHSRTLSAGRASGDPQC